AVGGGCDASPEAMYAAGNGEGSPFAAVDASGVGHFVAFDVFLAEAFPGEECQQESAVVEDADGGVVDAVGALADGERGGPGFAVVGGDGADGAGVDLDVA